ncbi:class A beta-lactamase [soil metagenome]
MTMNRRQFTRGLLLAPGLAPLFADAAGNDSTLAARLAKIERASGGRLGVCIFDMATDRRVGHREHDRFPMCSTFKLLAAAAVLARVDQGRDALDSRVVIQPADLLPNSPVTQARVGGAGMTVAQLCEAAITVSDNAAGNLLLVRLGGPSGVTDFARSLGDPHTRLDRNELALNESLAGDPRDTTTPDAMVGNLQKLLLGNALSAESREQLLQWLDANQTGAKRLRAGLPLDWQVGDKTGSGQNGTTNDVAILRPPGRLPMLVSAYLTATPAASNARNATLAAVGAAVAASVRAA